MWLMFGEILVILLTIASLYFLGSLLSNEILWLEVANADIIRDIISHENRFQLAFFVLQFILTVGTFAGAGSLWYFRRMEIVDKKTVYFTIGATFALWIRAFSELVVTTKYHHIPNGTSAARETIYGLCTVLFLYLIKPSEADLSFNTDPLQEKIEENTRRYILREVESIVTTGHQAPVLRTILSTIERNPATALSEETRKEVDKFSREEKERVTEMHQTILATLTARYGHLGESDV